MTIPFALLAVYSEAADRDSYNHMGLSNTALVLVLIGCAALVGWLVGRKK